MDAKIKTDCLLGFVSILNKFCGILVTRKCDQIKHVTKMEVRCNICTSLNLISKVSNYLIHLFNPKNFEKITQTLKIFNVTLEQKQHSVHLCLSVFLSVPRNQRKTKNEKQK